MFNTPVVQIAKLFSARLAYSRLRHRVQLTFESVLGLVQQYSLLQQACCSLQLQPLELAFQRPLVDSPYRNDNELSSKDDHQELGRFSSRSSLMSASRSYRTGESGCHVEYSFRSNQCPTSGCSSSYGYTRRSLARLQEASRNSQTPMEDMVTPPTAHPCIN